MDGYESFELRSSEQDLIVSQSNVQTLHKHCNLSETKNDKNNVDMESMHIFVVYLVREKRRHSVTKCVM